MGWKVEGGEKDIFPSPSKGHQIGVFLRFLPIFFKGVNLDNLFFYFRTWFSIWILENLFLQLILGEEEWLIIVDSGKKENRLDDNNTFERMKMSKGRFGVWNLKKNL
jgi:hypothetical protein